VLGGHQAGVRPGQRGRHHAAEVAGVRVDHRRLDAAGGQGFA
jgi:hypothetical protein